MAGSQAILVNHEVPHSRWPSRKRKDSALHEVCELTFVSKTLYQNFSCFKLCSIYYMYVFICMQRACAWHNTCVKAENNIWELDFTFHHVGPRDQTRVIRLGAKHLSPLSHPDSHSLFTDSIQGNVFPATRLQAAHSFPWVIKRAGYKAD